MDISIKSNIAGAGVETDESHFWKSFKSVASGVAIPTQPRGYDKGAEFNIAHGLTVVRGTVAGTAGKLVEAYKRTDDDDKTYLAAAGFKLNRQLDVPAIELKR